MKIVYKLDSKYIGKAHYDNNGVIILHDKLSQRVLKELYNKGNKFVYVYEA